MSAPVRIEHLSECRAALLGRRHMEFILVNGRHPDRDPIGASYLREIATTFLLRSRVPRR